MKNLKFKISNLKSTIFSRKVWIGISLIIVLLMFQGCTSSEEITEYTAPNWTSDGKIVFIKDFNHIKERHFFTDETNLEGSYEVLTLCEINSDGSGFREIRELTRSERHAFTVGINTTSSAGDWVTFDLRTEDNSVHSIYIIRRDGTDFNNTGIEGQNPDFSPDASHIVYERPENGIWIMDRDGGNNHQIISDADARYPSWSSDDTLIAYGEWNTCVIKITGDSLKTYNSHRKPDWGPQGSNLIVTASYYGYPIITDISTNESDTLDYFQSGYGIKWSPDSIWLCSETSQGILVIGIDGTSSHYITP